MSFTVGAIVGGYEVIDTLGVGGMGQVYKVRNRISGRVEAMKVLIPDLENDPEAAARFLREIQVLADLRDTHIAELYTAFQFENQLVMVMEFVEGTTLAERLKAGHVLLEDGLSYVCQTLSALAYAHSRGVIHRDIKPSNIMIMPDGRVKLTDFGIAKAETDRKLTKTGTTLGSVYYMSPEQVESGAGELDGRSDLYSVGVILYEIATGKVPFEGDSDYAIMTAQVKTTPTPPIDLEPGLPRELNDIILTALAKDRRHRYQSAEEFLEVLYSLEPRLREHAGSERSVPNPPRPHADRRTAYMLVGSIAAIVILIAIAVLLPKLSRSTAMRSSNPSSAQQNPPIATKQQQVPSVEAPAVPPSPSRSEHPPSGGKEERGRARRTEITRSQRTPGEEKLPRQNIPKQVPEGATTPAANESSPNLPSETPTASRIGQRLWLRYNVRLFDTDRRYLGVVDPDRHFQPGEIIQLEFEANHSGYIYILDHESGGGWKPLFPLPGMRAQSNAVVSLAPIQVPAGHGYQISDPAGVDRFFVVLSINLEDTRDLQHAIMNSGSAYQAPEQRDSDAGPLLTAENHADLGQAVERIKDSLGSRDIEIVKLAQPTDTNVPPKSVYFENVSDVRPNWVVTEILIHHE